MLFHSMTSVKCGASMIVMDDTGKITVSSTNCANSMPTDTFDLPDGAVVFEDVEGGPPSTCKGFTSFQLDGSGHARITTDNDCVTDRDIDGIPGVNDVSTANHAGHV